MPKTVELTDSWLIFDAQFVLWNKKWVNDLKTSCEKLNYFIFILIMLYLMNPIVSDESFGNGLNVVEYFLYLIVIQLYPVQNGTSNTDYEISVFVKGHVTNMSHVI